MDKEMNVCFGYLIGYIQAHHYNRLYFSACLDELGSRVDTDLQALHCLYRIGQQLNITHKDLNKLCDETKPDTKIRRG